MKRIRIPKYFTLNGLIIFVALFCISTYAFFEDMSISIVAFSSMKLPLLYVGFACLVFQIKTIFRCVLKKKRFYTLAALALFCVMLVIVMFFNFDVDVGASPFRYTLRLLLFLTESFLLMIVIAETGRGNAALRFLLWYLLVIVIVNDILMFTGLIRFTDTKRESYFVGTKFSVSYLHMYLLTAWLACRKYKQKQDRYPWWVVVLLASYIVLVAIRTDCMTGVLGCIVLVALSVMMEKRRWTAIIRFSSPWIMLAALLTSVIFAFVAELIMEIPLFRFVVEDVLKRDASITGRTYLYQMYVENLEGNWLTGYGYGNGNTAAVELFGYQTMQNGLLQWVLEIGVPSTIALVVLIIQTFFVINDAMPDRKRRYMPLLALIYTFVVLGTVEANFNMAFIMWITIAYMMATEKRKVQMK